MNERRCVAPSTDVRDEGTHYTCCAICGLALRVANQWWCGPCGRQYDLTDYATAPEWVRFLVLDERKRRGNFDRDADLVSWEGIGEAEDANEEAGIAQAGGELDPAIAEAEMRIDGELWLKKQSPADVHLLHLLQDGNTQAEAAKELRVTQKTVSLSVARLKASLHRFLEA